MVCKKCEKKLSKLITPEVKKSNNLSSSTSGPIRSSLKKSSKSSLPYGNKCTTCRSIIHQPGASYCQSCAYKRGICSMCGKEILDTSKYKMSANIMQEKKAEFHSPVGI